MWVVPTSGKASWQITADISSCSNRSPLTSCWSRWEEFTPSFPLWQMRTCMYVCVGDCAQGQRQEKDNGVAGCRRSSCSTYMIAVLWGWTTKKGDALFKTPHISAAGTWQFTSRFLHTNCKEETHRQTKKKKKHHPTDLSNEWSWKHKSTCWAKKHVVINNQVPDGETMEQSLPRVQWRLYSLGTVKPVEQTGIDIPTAFYLHC